MVARSLWPSLTVRAEGLEPPRAFAHKDLNLARRPVAPRPQDHPILGRELLHIDGAACMFRDMALHKMLTPGYTVIYPNREKAGSKTTKAIVVLILLVSVVLMLIVTVGGWSKLQGMKPVNFVWCLAYL